MRMLANARLGLLPIEEDTGRWTRPKTVWDQRVCKLGCAAVGTLRHFLTECDVLQQPTVQDIHTVAEDRRWVVLSPVQWKRAATGIARRMQERTKLLRTAPEAGAAEEKELEELELIAAYEGELAQGQA